MYCTRNLARRSLCSVLVSALGVVLAAPATAQVSIPFIIDQGEVRPQDSFAVELTILGCAIGHSAHGGYDSKVTMQIRIEEPDGSISTFEPFGPFLQPIEGNINNGVQQRKVLFGIWGPESKVSLTGRSHKWDGGGDANSNWSTIDHTENSFDNPYVVVLRDGDFPPSLPGFQDQASAKEFVAPYIDDTTGRMKLTENQAIYLFELGASSTSSSGFDLQDAVILMTLAANPVALDATAAAHD